MFCQVQTFAQIETSSLNQVQEVQTDANYNESINTTPMTRTIDEKTAKSPYENDFQETKPHQQSEFTVAVFMFLKVMAAVAICSVMIFFILLGVRKFYGIPETTVENPQKIEDNLKTTQSENEALKIFFNKTKNQ
ncbi:MAG: hypothetical protein E7Z91_01725 [Cyanobacteria bacterium SIG30]|nr:hypothetical protein [Cyanobacteria bacterium SIG30]